MSMLEIALGLAILTAIAHSFLSERLFLIPLREREAEQGIRGEVGIRLTTLMFHFPSILWVAMGVSLLLLDAEQAGYREILVMYGLLYAMSGVGNLWATRKIHPGGILLLSISGLIFSTLATRIPPAIA